MSILVRSVRLTGRHTSSTRANARSRRFWNASRVTGRLVISLLEIFYAVVREGRSVAPRQRPQASA